MDARNLSDFRCAFFLRDVFKHAFKSDSISSIGREISSLHDGALLVFSSLVLKRGAIDIIFDVDAYASEKKIELFGNDLPIPRVLGESMRSLFVDSVHFNFDCLTVKGDKKSALHDFLFRSDIEADVVNCSKIQVSKKKLDGCIRDFKISQKREAYKDLFVVKQAPSAMLTYLFGDENEEGVKSRRIRLDTRPPHGRAPKATIELQEQFEKLWHDNQKKTEVERFLMAHSCLGLSFATLWIMHKENLSIMLPSTFSDGHAMKELRA